MIGKYPSLNKQCDPVMEIVILDPRLKKGEHQ